MSAVDELPPEKAEEVKTVFNLYDYKKQGYLPADLVGKLCKNLGAYVTEDDLKAFTDSHFKEGSITLDVFLEFFAEHYIKKLDKQELINAFQFLDRGKTGQVDARELKHALMVVGDKIKESEADELLDGFVERGMLDYRNFANEVAK